MGATAALESGTVACRTRRRRQCPDVAGRFTRTEFDLTTQTLISVQCLDANNVQVQDAIALAAIGGFASGGVGLFLLAHPNAYLKVCSIPTGWTYSTTGNSIIFMCNGDFHVDISCNPMRIDGWWTLGSFSGQPPSTLFECTSTHPITQPDGTTKYELLAFTPTMVCGAVGTQQPTEGAVLSFVFTLFGLSASFMLILIALGINIGGTAGIPIIGQFTATFGSKAMRAQTATFCQSVSFAIPPPQPASMPNGVPIRIRIDASSLRNRHVL